MKTTYQKWFSLLLAVALTTITVSTSTAQGVGINNTGAQPDPSAILDVSSPDRGVLLPRMNTVQRDNINNPATGLLIYNTDADCINMWVGFGWRPICGNCDFTPPIVGSNSPVCPGFSINLTASFIPGATYSWTGPNGFSSTAQNPSISNVTAANDGVYSVVATANGCAATPVTTLVSIHSAPPASAGADATICFGDNTTLTASGGTSYAWSSGSNSAGTTVSPATTTTYAVTVTDGNGCTASDDAIVNVNPLPPAFAGNDTIINVGSSATLTATGGISYAWSTGGNTATISVSPSALTTYTVTVTDGNGCSTTDAVVVALKEWNFTTCANIGRFGPSQSQCNAEYSGTSLGGNVTVSGGIQAWVVPQSGTYRIEAGGAAGGELIDSYYGKIRGNGAVIRGDFSLTTGETIYFLVGQQGETRTDNPKHGGGGGGTFVYKNVNDTYPLLAAGGGTGDVNNSDGAHGSSSTTPSAGNGSGAAGGGSGGNGGGGAVGGGGAGWIGNGVNGSVGSYYGQGGNSPRNGGQGGAGQPTGYGDSAYGGFGGGGSGGNQNGASGGGGGYNGGGGGNAWNGSSWGAGGGGGSYNGGSNQQNTSGANSDPGYVKVSYVGP